MEATIGFAVGFILGAGLMAIISVNAYNKQAEELKEEKENNRGLANTINEIKQDDSLTDTMEIDLYPLDDVIYEDDDEY